MNFKRCHICYFGKPMGEFEGLPICEECLSHRMEITEEMRYRKEGETPKFLELPKMKPESEWKWWQQVARERAFEMMDALHDRLNAGIEENINLRHKLKACNVLRIRNFLSLLRLRVGFAKMVHLFFKKYYPNSKDEKYWFNIMHNFIFKYERYKKATEGYDS